MRPPNKSRSRNKNNRRNNNNSGGNSLNRVHDSAGPEGRVRGTPVQVIEKYQALAHDYSLAGDRVATENFQQHAEHYIRLINEAQRQNAERREQMESQNQNQQQPKPQNNGHDQNNHQNSNQNRNEQNNRAAADPAKAEQPDVAPQAEMMPTLPIGDAVEPAQPNDNGGLVETPESAPVKEAKPKRARAPRKPKVVEEPTPPASEA